ncbi:non-specific lipid-transfer protein-like protein [Iris pallida]|uniref:Non-specific lipid-transfer protein-like protein n=1 Tax=Iris pallida TaxID=29817 RepID=A0AAX6DXX6_IRIPA|nr:non-specific lipid-transfer protein-like protein [Iris pallida]
MAQGRLEMCLALVLMTAMWVETSAQPNPNCMPAITSLSPCLGFITGNSSTPSTSCCTQLASVVQTQAQCLCTVLNGAPQLPFVVNQTQALTLPGACNIQTPPLSQCNAASGSAPPAPAPTSTETPTAATTAPSPSTSTPSVPSGTTTPATPSAPSALPPLRPLQPLQLQAYRQLKVDQRLARQLVPRRPLVALPNSRFLSCPSSWQLRCSLASKFAFLRSFRVSTSIFLLPCVLVVL